MDADHFCSPTIGSERSNSCFSRDKEHDSLKDQSSFRIGDFLKTSRPGHHSSEENFETFTPDPELCVVAALRICRGGTGDLGGSFSSVLITSRKPIRPAFANTIGG